MPIGGTKLDFANDSRHQPVFCFKFPPMSTSAPAAKVLLLGDANVGKTSLRSQFIHHRFSSAYRATVGGDFLTAKVPTSFAPRRLPNEQRNYSNYDSFYSSDNNSKYTNDHTFMQRTSFSQPAEPETVSMQVWDTAGQERFDSLVRSFFRGTDVAILVYDVTDAASFSHLRKWLEDFITHAFVRNPIIVVVGNKIDRSQYRTVSERQARAFAEDAAEAYGLMAPPTFTTNVVPNNTNFSSSALPSPSFGTSTAATGMTGMPSPSLNSNFSRNSNVPSYFKIPSQSQTLDDNESLFETPRSPSVMAHNLQRQNSLQAPSLSLSANTNNNISNINNVSNPNGVANSSNQNTTTNSVQPAIQCFEVSAKDNIDVDKLFTYVADRIVAARREVILDFDTVDAQSASGSIRGTGAFGGMGSIDIGNSSYGNKRSNSKSGFGFCC